MHSVSPGALKAVCGIAVLCGLTLLSAGTRAADPPAAHPAAKPPMRAPFGGHRDSAVPTAGETGGAAYTYVHHPVSTVNPAAQFAFDRGLTLVMAYQSDEAKQAFREAAKLDPALAMAWWGIALALGPNINSPPEPDSNHDAAEAMVRAESLAGASKTTEVERDYIAALKVRYSATGSPDFDAMATRYRDAMRDLVQKYPQDPDARALFAEAIMDLHPWRLWNTDGTPQAGTEELVQMLEEGLSQQPNHMGLLHFYIHAVEASPNPGRALDVAHRLAALPMEPAASHLVHMPAHIYMRVGDWESAVQANEHSVHQALDYKLSSNPSAKEACGHCADFLSYAYMMQANEADARRSADNYRKLTDDPTNSVAVLIRFNRWGEILKLPQPTEDAKKSAPDVHVLRGQWHYARGLAFIAQHKVKDAEAELQALHSELQLAPQAADYGDALDLQHGMDKLFRSSYASNMQLAQALLGSRVAEARHQMPMALRLMQNAVALQDSGPYSEPPLWFYPTRESLGALLLRTGSAGEAEAVFRESLKRVPNDPRALLGLVKALQVQGKKGEADVQKLRLQDATRFGDTTLTLAQM